MWVSGAARGANDAALVALDLSAQPEFAGEVCRYVESNPHHIGYLDRLGAKDGKSAPDEARLDATIISAAIRGFAADNECDANSIAQAMAECALGHSWRRWP
jgi:hypothetical protein